MANIKLKDATKELTQGAEQALNEASRLRKSADQMMAQLREMEKTFNRKAQEAADLARKEEERRAKATQSRAYTAESGYVMEPVEEAQKESKPEKPAAAEKPVQEAKAAPAEQPAAPKAEAPMTEKAEKPAQTETAASAPKAEPVPAKKETEAPAAAEKKAEAKPEVKPEPKAEVKAEPKAEVKAEPKAEVKAEAPKAAEKPEEKKEEKQEKPEAAKPAEKPAPAPAAKQEKTREVRTEKPKDQKPKRPAIGQIISRPGDPLPVQKPVGLAPNVVRPPRPVDQQPRIHRKHPQLHVNPVQNRTRKAAQVGLSLPDAAGAAVPFPIIPARTGVRGRHQHKRRRILHPRTKPGNRHLPVLQRGPERFRDGFRNLGEFVQEEDPVLRQGNLSGQDIVPATAADDGRQGGTVMRGPEGAAA